MATFHTPMVTLNDGNLIPQIGLGVLRIDDEGVTSVVESALEAGYRHIDGAAGYNNEAGVGRALNNAGFTEGEQRKTCGLRRNCAIPSRGMTAHARRSTASLACCSSIMSTCTCCIGPPRSTGVPAKRGRRSRNSARRGACARWVCAISCPSISTACMRRPANILPSTRLSCIRPGSSARSWTIARRTALPWKHIRRWLAVLI